MKIRFLISLSSNALNIANIGYSMVFIAFFSNFGIIGVVLNLLIIYNLIRLLFYYQVYTDVHYFYFSRFIIYESKIECKKLNGYKVSRIMLFFKVYKLQFDDGEKYDFIKLPQILFNQRNFSIEAFFSELINKNVGL